MKSSARTAGAMDGNEKSGTKARFIITLEQQKNRVL
jgi:hypothetical protein